MKILCVIDSLGSGGAQRQLVELALGFKELGHEVSFLVYHEENFFNETLENAGILIKFIGENNYWKRLLKMRKYIRSNNMDVVLSFLEAANFIATLSGFPYRKWKLIVGERSANPNVLNSFKLRMYRWLHLFSDYVVANSNANINMVKQINPLLPKKKCKVIYNIVDEEKWSFDNDVNLGTKKISEKFNLTVLASHQYLKNAKGLIEALNLLPESSKQKLQVYWYGGGSNDDSFEKSCTLVQQYELKDVISFHPPVTNAKEVMVKADCIGLFSHYEGLPNVICEAMMLGKPVLASRVSDVPNFLKEDMVFNPINYPEIAETITRVMSTESLMLLDIGVANKVKAKRLFAKQHILKSYIDLFK